METTDSSKDFQCDLFILLRIISPGNMSLLNVLKGNLTIWPFEKTLAEQRNDKLGHRPKWLQLRLD